MSRAKFLTAVICLSPLKTGKLDTGLKFCLLHFMERRLLGTVAVSGKITLTSIQKCFEKWVKLAQGKEQRIKIAASDACVSVP